MIPLHSRMLGRLPSKPDGRTLLLRNYLRHPVTPPPPARLWHSNISDWGVMGNDQYGNCVIVTAAHAILLWRANELDDTRRITDSAVIALSREMGALDGYNILDRLKYWRNDTMFGDRLWAFLAVEPADIDRMKITINSFGVADIGIALATAWQDAEVWDTGSGRDFQPGSWGLHSVPIVGYDENYVYLSTWGYIQKMTWRAVPVYCDEAYALIDANWIAGDSIAPSGLNLEALHADLWEATGQGLPRHLGQTKRL